MQPRVLKVTFEVDAQRTDDGRFTVPVAVGQALGLGGDSQIHLEIWSSAGLTVGIHGMASGTEVYETQSRNHGLRKVVRRGERLLITASRPPC